MLYGKLYAFIIEAFNYEESTPSPNYRPQSFDLLDDLIVLFHDELLVTSYMKS